MWIEYRLEVETIDGTRNVKGIYNMDNVTRLFLGLGDAENGIYIDDAYFAFSSRIAAEEVLNTFEKLMTFNNDLSLLEHINISDGENYMGYIKILRF